MSRQLRLTRTGHKGVNKRMEPYFVQTPENPSTLTYGYFIIGIQHGSWGHDVEIDCYLDGVNEFQTNPKGSVDFAIQFDECPVGAHEAQFIFHRVGNAEELARLDYAWEVTA